MGRCPETAGRQPFLDHLRAVLTALVVFHHAALTYGAIGGWYWRERPEGSSALLVLFCTLNQAFFMGLFFLIAGELTPAPFDRKGARQYFRDRAVRLGVPLLLYGLVIGPFTIAISTSTSIQFRWLLQQPLFDFGPLWFAQALLIFAALYTAWRAVRPDSETAGPPGHLALLGSAVLVGAAAFVIRLAYPVGDTVLGMQPGYFASYAVLFAAGASGRWLGMVPPRIVVPWLAVSSVAFLLGIWATMLPGPHHFAGGWYGDAMIYAFWEPFVGWGIILGLLWSFHRLSNRPRPVFDWLGRRAFACYVVHPPVLVAVSRGLTELHASPLLKTIGAGSLACLGCLVVSSLVLCMPGLRRVF